MKKISLFLDRVALKILKPETVLKLKFQRLIKEKLGADLAFKDLRVSGRTIFLHCPPVLKSEILLRREEIISALGSATLKEIV